MPLVEKAVKGNKKPLYIETLAHVYYSLGRYNEALEQFESCLKLYLEREDSEKVKETEEKIADLKELMNNE